MSLPHPTYNAIVRSVFEWWTTPNQVDWSEHHLSAKLRKSSAAKVQAQNEAGMNTGKIHGLSKKSDQRLAQINHEGVYGRAVERKRDDLRTVDSDTQKLRDALEVFGAMSSAELSKVTGLPITKVPALLKYDRRFSRIVQIKGPRPWRYATAEWVKAHAVVAEVAG